MESEGESEFVGPALSTPDKTEMGEKIPEGSPAEPETDGGGEVWVLWP